MGGRPLQLDNDGRQTDTVYIPKPLASRCHASNAALQIGINMNDAMHRVNYGLLTFLGW